MVKVLSVALLPHAQIFFSSTRLKYYLHYAVPEEFLLRGSELDLSRSTILSTNHRLCFILVRCSWRLAMVTISL
jgi:hypothetical protein